MFFVNTNLNLKKYYSLSILIAIIYIYYSLSGSTNDKSMYMSFFLILLWIVLAFYSNNDIFHYCLIKKESICLLIYFLYLFFTGIFQGGVLNTIKIIGQALIYFSPILLYNYYRNLSLYKLKTLLIWSCVFILYFILKSLIFYNTYTDAARKLASDISSFGNISIGGGYTLAYAVVLFVVFLFDIVINGIIKNIKIKSLLLFSIFLMIFLVLSTRSTLTILCLFFGIALSILFKKSEKKNQLFTVVLKFLLFLIIIIFTFSLQEEIGLFILNFTQNKNDVVSLRFQEIAIGLINGFASSEYLSMRLNIPLKSLYTFIQSPVIGKGYEYGYVWANSYPYLGGHGEWADILGSKGLVGGLIIYLIYFFPLKLERKYSKNYLSISYILTFILLGVFNPILSFQPNLILFFIIPSISVFLFSNNNKVILIK